MSLAHYYAKGKAGLMGINTGEAVQHGEDLLIAGGTGLALGLVSASIGGLDHTVAGVKVPVDGMASMGLALAGLAMRSPELKVASIAAGGSASTRWFEDFFKKSLGAHGDFDGSDIPFGYGYGGELPPAGGSYGYSAEDRLARFAEAL